MASYSDILFGKIVIKNGLAPLASVQECLQIQEQSKARGVTMTLPEVLIARAVISEEQAKLAQRAQALTQFQRAEAIYAKIANEKGIPIPTLQKCFEAQKARQFKARIAQILIEQRLITPEQNEEIADEQIMRLAEETRIQEEAGLTGTPAAAPPVAQSSQGAPQRTADSWRPQPAPQPDPRARSSQGAAPPPQPRALTDSDRGRQGGNGSPPQPVVQPTPGRAMQLDIPSAFPGLGAAQSIPFEELANMSVRGGRLPGEMTGANKQIVLPPGTPSPTAGPPKADDPSSLIGKTISSRYRILEKLGEGGMGTVYKAEHCLMEKIVAFKVLHPHLIANRESLERFRREVRAASKFQHKNVVQIYDAGEGEGGIFYMAMEFVEGKSLEDYLREGPLTLDRTLVILRQALKAIGEAHKKGIVHRDLKSDNIMITKGKHGEDVVKVMDFGIAKLIDGADAAAESQGHEGDRLYKTMEGVVTGTPQYMSPEQASGEKVDHRADLYSLGVILFEMITGQLPFQSNTPMGFLGKHIVEPPPLPSAMCAEKGVPAPPENLEKIVMKLLEKKPDDRYQSAGDIATDLDATVTKELFDVSPGSGSLSGDRLAPKQVKQKSPLLPLLIVGGAALIFAIVMVIAIVMIFGGPNPTQVRHDAVVKAETLLSTENFDAAEKALADATKKVGDDDEIRALVAKIAEARKEATFAAEVKKLTAEAEGLKKAEKLEEAAAKYRELKTKLDGAGEKWRAQSDAIDKTLGELDAEIKKRGAAKEAKDKVGQAKDARKSGDLAKALGLLDDAERVAADDATKPEMKKEIALERARVESDEMAKTAQELRARDLAKALAQLDKAIERAPDDDQKKALAAARTQWQQEAEKRAARDALESKLAQARDKLVALDGAGAEQILAGVDGASSGLGDRIQVRREAATALKNGLAREMTDLLGSVKRLEDLQATDPLRTKPEDVSAARAKLDDGKQHVSALKDGEVADELRKQLDQALLRLKVVENSLKDNQRSALSDAVRRFNARLAKLKAEIPDKEKTLQAKAIVDELYQLKDTSGYRDATKEDKQFVEDGVKRYSALKLVLDELVKPRDGWARVRGGAYELAATKEKQQLPDVYYVSDHETTRAEWNDYMKAKGLESPEGEWAPDDKPVTSITFDEAVAYARWLSDGSKLVEFRLPTEAEWERAARGDRGADYPWGNEWREGVAAVGGEVKKIKSFPTRNDLGLYDTVGNVAEMTSSRDADGKMVTKGGSVISRVDSARASQRVCLSRSQKNISLGFRLVAVEKK